MMQLGELLVAVAVVVSVVFVAIEIRQNSQAQIRSTTQEAVGNYISSLERLVDNPDFSCLYIRGVQDYRALSGADRSKITCSTTMMTRHADRHSG